MTIEKTLVVLGTFVAAAYLLIGIVGGLLPSHWGEDASATDQIVWLVLIVGGGSCCSRGFGCRDACRGRAPR